MISGDKLRNIFNLTMRRLYSLKDYSTGSVSGRSGGIIFNNKSYVDIYIAMCSDEIHKYDNKNLSENDLINFIQGIKRITLHFFDNNIKEETRKETKKLIREYLNEIIVSYDSSSVKQELEETMGELIEFKKEGLISKGEKYNYSPDEDSKGISFNKGYSEEEKTRESKQKIIRDSYREEKKANKKEKHISEKEIKDNSRHNTKNKIKDNKEKKEKYVSKKVYGANSWQETNTKNNRDKLEESEPVHTKKHHKKKKTIPFAKVVFFVIFILVLMGTVYYVKSMDSQDSTIVENISEAQYEPVLEKPPEPVLKEFTLTPLEESLFTLINTKRIQYQKSEYYLNMKLSEINNEYFYILLTESEAQAKAKVGSSVERGKQSDAGTNMIESKYIFDRGITAEKILSSISMSNLYIGEYNGLGLAIIDYNNKTNVLISIYKNG